MNVYLDGEFAFGVAVAVAMNLRVGAILSDADVAALRAADEGERARERALDYLSYRPRSVAELHRYLVDKGFSDTTVEEVLERLQDVGLVDDVAFARFWIENRARFRPRGRRMLRYELRQRGVPDSVIGTVLADYDERAAAEAEVADQARRLAHLPPEVLRQRIQERLARRGFSYDLIREVIDACPSSHFYIEESEED